MLHGDGGILVALNHEQRWAVGFQIVHRTHLEIDGEFGFVRAGPCGVCRCQLGQQQGGEDSGDEFPAWAGLVLGRVCF